MNGVYTAPYPISIIQLTLSRPTQVGKIMLSEFTRRRFIGRTVLGIAKDGHLLYGESMPWM